MLPSASADRGAATLVTPDAVVLRFETAGLASRLLAWLLDQLVVWSSLFAVTVAMGAVAAAVGPGGETVLAVVLLLGLAGAVLGYPIAMETFWGGRTLGKAVLGLRVVTVEGAPVSFRHAAARGALGLVDFYATSGAAAALSVLLSPRDQRLGDFAAGTVVLRERTAAGRPRPARFDVPPGWERYAATIDVSGVTGADYEAIRAFLLRAPHLAPAARAELAFAIADPLAVRLRHTPPPDVPPEVFLACVAARRQAAWRGR